MDVEAITTRGRAMGLQPRRHAISAGERVTRKWRIIPVYEISRGDTIAHAGIVVDIWVQTGDDVPVRWIMEVGVPDSRVLEVDTDRFMRVFTEVDMTYAKIEDKGVVHITAQSLDVDTFGGTLCGKEGQMVLVADSEVGKVCAACTKVADEQTQG